MREIKFRAWDKKENIMIDDVGIYGNRAVDSASKMYDTPNMEIEALDAIPMQYTGLKDKNGKEIYEGDIVKWQNMNTLDKEIRTTPVSLQSIGDGKNHIIQAYYPFCNTISGSYKEGYRELVECYITPSDDCEIIGNVYENPDLLTQKP